MCPPSGSGEDVTSMTSDPTYMRTTAWLGMHGKLTMVALRLQRWRDQHGFYTLSTIIIGVHFAL
jgi:hypothetical protein